MGTINRNAYPLFDKSFANEIRLVTYAGPASYATGGDAFTPGTISLGKIGAVTGLTITNGATVYWGVYNATTQKILWYSATATEVPNTTDLSGFSGTFVVFGK